jgi:hypothetical protein
MGIPENIWTKMRRGEYPETDATILEVVCSVGRQLAYRLEKLIDLLERGPEEPPLVTVTTTEQQQQQLLALMRLVAASYPRDHRIVAVTAAGNLIATNPLPYSIPILVTNLDNAQFLFYGTSASTVLNSPMIDPESKEKIMLSPNSDLFGIVVGAAISVAVSNLDLPTV